MNLFKRKHNNQQENDNHVTVIIERTSDHVLMEYLIVNPEIHVQIRSKNNKKFSDIEIYDVNGECYKSQAFDDGNRYEYSVFYYHDGKIDRVFNSKGKYNDLSVHKRNNAMNKFSDYIQSLRISVA